jgi:hypothetical protein
VGRAILPAAGFQPALPASEARGFAMASVPGFDHDVFISYAHGDDRDWINRHRDEHSEAG